MLSVCVALRVKLNRTIYASVRAVFTSDSFLYYRKLLLNLKLSTSLVEISWSSESLFAFEELPKSLELEDHDAWGPILKSRCLLKLIVTEY